MNRPLRSHTAPGSWVSFVLKEVRSDERGIAVIVAMMGLLIISALAAALVLGTSTETLIARNFRMGAGAAYAAEAVARQALEELASVSDWNAVVNGSTRSVFADGGPGGDRTLSDGSRINVSEILNFANCGKRTTCSNAEMNATTVERPWSQNNPRWQLYAYGKLADEALPGVINSAFYVVLLVADDPSETDGNPSIDSADGSPGSGVLMLRAEAFGPSGTHAAIECTVARTDPAELSSIPGTPPIRIISWRLSR